MLKMLMRTGLAALVIRVLYLIQHAASPFFGFPFLDQHYYDLCARQLAGEGGIQLIDGFRPLLYPLFLSPFYKLSPGSGMLLATTAQHILGIGMCCMAAWLAARLFKSMTAGYVSGLLFALSPVPLYFEGELMIATLFSFLLLWVWILVFKATEARNIKTEALLWLGSGLVLGLSAQARPNALPVILAFGVVSAYRLIIGIRGNKPFNWVKSTLPLLSLAGLLAVQVVFAALNANYSGRFNLMTQAGGINFYLGNSAKADGMVPRQSSYVYYDAEYRDPIQTMAEQGYREANGLGREAELDPKDVSDFWKAKTLAEIKQDPGRWIGLMAKKGWLMLWNHEVPNNRSFSFVSKQESPLLDWLPVRWCVLLALSTLGLVVLVRQRKTEFLLWVLFSGALFTLTLLLFFINSRFRVPLWPGLAVLSGGSAVLVTELRTNRKLWYAVGAAGVVALASCINLWQIPPDAVDGDYASRAKAYQRIGKHNEALPDIEMSLATNPSHAGYNQQHGNILLALGRPGAAVQAYLKAVAAQPDNPMLHNNIGVALEEAGKPEQAVIAYSKALELWPGFTSASANLAALHIRNNQLDDAMQLIDSLPPAQRKSPRFRCLELVLAYKKSGDSAALQMANQIDDALVTDLLGN